MEKTYNKQNSFLKFHSLKKQNEKETLKYLKNILDDKSKLKSLNKYQLSIIDLVKKDLFTEKNTNSPKFQLSPSVIKELELINKKEIPKYLFHRYRYEIHPQIRISDDYPPYLQIEPTSICNYRCVFCYQTDNTFNKRF